MSDASVMQRPILQVIPSRAADAEAYARWCDVQSVSAPTATDSASLCLDALGLGLLMPGEQRVFRLSQHRPARRQRGAKLSELGRACGIQHGPRQILDACAGFGADALTLAALGAEVVCIEANLIVWLLLRDFTDGLLRGPVCWGSSYRMLSGDQDWCCDSPESLHGFEAQETSLAVTATTRWDVIYLDPMFPPSTKSALPNQGLQHLRQLVTSTGPEVEAWLAAALPRARDRVVVKRRRKDPVLAKPTFQISGKTVRFDVYQI